MIKKIHINNDDNYATPPDFYNELNKRFNFDFDPCPYNENKIVNDGLKIEWGKSNFVNPPYSRKVKEEFVKKGIEEMEKQQIIDACQQGFNDAYFSDPLSKEQYYNETYKK